ncbi:dienelactone hydrolase-related enzyme [Cereibacter sp. SYSU M97828]|nr:dienelactone hydrolase-related enzyme [Cereibacter flavus]
MLLSILDRWDEQRAVQGEKVKAPETFHLGVEEAFPDGDHNIDLDGFYRRAEMAVSDPSYYSLPDAYAPQFEYDNGWLSFASSVQTGIPENNRVVAKVNQARSSRRALLVFHHWNASSRQSLLEGYFRRRGLTVIEVAMPYHFERGRPGAAHADFMLSANLGRTLQSVRQATLDGRSIIQWLKGRGFEGISVLGMSLGSWVAGLVAAHDPDVSKASLFLTADSLADMVWSGRATHAIRKGLEPAMSLTDLRKAWRPCDLGAYVQRLSRSDLDLQVVLARRDKVVRPDLTRRFVRDLKQAGADLTLKELPCGHYSLALPPFSLMAGISLQQFFER